MREEDFGKFDMIVVMDDRNYEHVHRLAPSRADAARIFRMREFSAVTPAGIMFPIPITKGPRASSWCSTCWKTAVRGILAHLREIGCRNTGRTGAGVICRKTLPAPRLGMRNTGPEIPGRSVHVPGIP
ncbi:MAG: hypothetical protein ACLUQ6_04780 [Alistipes onderdonkii]